jgi:hypothetical protein
VTRAAAVALLVAFVTAVAVAVGRAATPGYWDRLAWCEERGQWHQRGSFYVGGLGIYWANWERWSAAVGVDGPAWAASREEQIRVARYGRRVDQAYWGCMAVVGMPW